MPKYCCVPNCNNAANSDRRSFYKFPLHDPQRLQLWLRNMGCENWTPSRYQYICHQHFTPSCFKVRWGIRYLESDAVPTVFQETTKHNATDHSQKKVKQLRVNTKESITVSGGGTPAADAAQLQSLLDSSHLYENTVDPLQQEETRLVGTSEDTAGFVQLNLKPPASVDGLHMEVNFPVTLFQMVNGLNDCGENTTVVMMCENPSGEHQEMTMNGLTTAILSPSHGLVMNDSTRMDELSSYLTDEDVIYTTEDVSAINDDDAAQVIAYFETIPNVLAREFTEHALITPETVLSSALSSKPITSTLPIVSKHLRPSPPSVALNTVEKPESEDSEGQDSSQEDITDQDDLQLEEHCYYKNRVSKEKLEAIVAGLQKKLKVLQQKHRRHLDKLVALENTVSQLRQTNLLHEERLQLLERAYIQTAAAVTDPGQTVAIIYEDDDTTYVCTPLTDTEKL
ncbi:THAP domain-containing protein 5-like [Thalassophryne amazonica]|uniref:THAP domain-containing protein 5-like n=1 Tax=Thalassophryne amazonica TaxID=390379 RepID=UPI001470A63C|nr:THAP domain-containing protein 5-like [Thalassophryne amazonica]